ncbi:MAG: ABC transporter permease [Synergistetes bacterium]|nr:ABC transporter permease [Synergistota bacterium]
MSGVRVVFWKELADYFGSRRFLILFLIIFVTSLSISYMASRGISVTTDKKYLFLALLSSSAGAVPSFVFFISFFGPLIGIVLGFDAISGERARGTLSLLISQPIYRDAVINGKFWAGVATVALTIASIIVIIAGVSMYALGVVPNAEEIGRVFVFFIASTIYISFWLSLGILFSILFERTSTSALVSIMVWIFFTFFMYMIAGVIADKAVPITRTATATIVAKHEAIKSMIMRISPAVLFEEISIAILNPSVRVFGVVFQNQIQGLLPTPLPLGQSIMVVWPQFVSLIALMLVCFAVSYVKFMRQEIRAT